MLKKEQFGLVFNTVFSLFFSAALTLFIKFSQHQLTAETFLMGLVPAFAINFVLGTFIPLVKVGSGFASLFTRNEKSLLFYLLRMFMIVLIMTAAMSLLVMFSEMGFTMGLVFAFIGSFPRTFLFAYIVGALAFPGLLKLTQMLCVK